MQVPAVCAIGFPVADSGTNKIDKQSKPYSEAEFVYGYTQPVSFDSKSDMNDIALWKNFCQEQIILNNIDYIA